MLSMMIAACKEDDDNGDPVNPPAENPEPSFTANISGDITDTISFTIVGGIQTTHSIIGSYASVSNLLSINVMELPMGYQFSLIGNKDGFGTGDFVASGDMGYGAYNDNDQGRNFLGTSATITIESSELLQNVVQATYLVKGSFSMTLEDNSTPPSQITIEGSFENVTIQVN